MTPDSSPITEVDIKRYARQILLPQVGGAGQKKLSAAKVLIVGLGGLGSPAALYLAAAGVGTLGLLDDDPVELTNLHRQILHYTPDLGRPKVQSAQAKLSALNPAVALNLHRLRLVSANGEAVLGAYDVVLDGSDNFPTRYLVNDVCVRLGKPLVSGAVLRWQGQVTTVLPGKGHCYRCVFPEPPEEGALQTCSEAGVMGAAAGVVGALMATEALKLLLGLPGLLTDRLLTLDLAAMKFREVPVKRDPACGTPAHFHDAASTETRP
jgi:adenylyltransferase/sulfurtransferase